MKIGKHSVIVNGRLMRYHIMRAPK